MLVMLTYFLFLKTQLKVKQTTEKTTPATAKKYIATARGMETVAMSSAGTPS